MITVVPIMKAAPGWSPSPFQAPAIRPRPRLAQIVSASPVTPPGGVVPGARPALIDSALVNLVFDSLGASACGILAYGSNMMGNKTWTIIYSVLTVALVSRAANNLYNVRER